MSFSPHLRSTPNTSRAQDSMAASSSVIVSNWIAFLSLTGAYLGLLVFALKYKGPAGKEAYYNGYREQNMLGVFINLFCAVAYFAKVIASHSDDDGFAAFTTIKYVDYMTTCPLLTLDMLWNLEAPYKCSSAALVLVCLTFAVATDASPAPANYVWFGTGLSFFIFSYTFILVIVKERLSFFTNCARDSNAKKSIGYLKVAMFSYFGIWIFFPVLWLIGPKGFTIISEDVQHVFHCLLDVIAKSCYGFALLYFKVFFDKKLAASGVDEEDFHKFSKDVTTHKDDEEDHRGRRHREVHLPTSNNATPKQSYTPYRRPSREMSQDGYVDSDGDLESGHGGQLGSIRSMSMRSPKTTFSTRSQNPNMKRAQSSGGFLPRRKSQDDGMIFSLSTPHELERGGHDLMPTCNSRSSAMDEPCSDEDEAAFVERARQQFEMHKARKQKY